MSTRRFLPALMALVLAALACSVNITDTPAPGIAPATAAPAATEAATPTEEIPPTTAAAALTLDQLKNADVQITGVAGTDSPQTVLLTDGKFERGTDPGDV